MNKIKPQDIVVIMPAYNESKYIARVIDKLSRLDGKARQFVIVDDGSSDITFEVINKKLAELKSQKKSPKINFYALRHKINLGKGSALKTGCEFAFQKLNAKAVVFMDSDDQHDPAELERFFTKLTGGAGLVFGVREFGREMPLVRIMGNRLGSYVIALFFGKYIPDIPSGFKAMTREVYEKINWQASDYGVEVEIAVKTARYGLPFSTVPISTIYHDMDRGMTLIDVFKMVFNVIWWRVGWVGGKK